MSRGRIFGKYTQFQWRVEQGLPQNTVATIAKTKSGYLWLGTVEGLGRFDGIRFTVFNSSNTPAIRSNLITALLEDRQNTLWIGSDGGGLAYLRNGRFGVYDNTTGLSDEHVTCLFEDTAGTLWIGTDGGGLNRFHDGRFEVITTRQGLPDDHVWALQPDGSGGLWIGTANGLAHATKQGMRVLTVQNGLPGNFIHSLQRDRTGNLWVATERGLCVRRGERFEAKPIPAGPAHPLVWSLAEDRDGNIWAGSQNALTRYGEGIAASYAAADGLPPSLVRSVYADEDGSIWVGLHDRGLCHLAVSRVSAYTVRDGVAGGDVRSIVGDSAGNLWFISSTGLTRFRDGEIEPYAGSGACTERASTMMEDSTKSLWLGGASLCRSQNGKFFPFADAHGITPKRIEVMLEASGGIIWMGSYGEGLIEFYDGQFKRYTKIDGFEGPEVLSLFQDRSGSIWIATRSNGVSRLRDGRFTRWTKSDGLGNNHVLCFYEDRTGTLWIGTHGGGLSRFRDGRFSTITSRDGLFDDLAFAILEDNSGNLWMSGNKGIYRASLRDLNAFAEGRVRHVDSFAYGIEDGMLNRECNQGNPAGWKTPDGRLWFATADGVAALDPQARDSGPPLVNIEGVLVQHRRLLAGEPIHIQPSEDELEIEYTAFSWRRAPEIRFKYRLTGLDQHWVDAGKRRTAYYSHLPAGNYTFQVIADNGEGAWNRVGQTLAISVLPRFYETLWFRALLAGLSVSAFAAAWQFRAAQFQKTQALRDLFSHQMIASQEGERKRIASELHDGLGQHLAVIKNLAMLATENPAESCSEQLRTITEQASQAIGEVREIAHNLRPIQLDRLGLTKAVKSMISRALAGGNIQATVEIDLLDGAFEREVEIHFYRIVQEGVNNILKHSEAIRAKVVARRNENSIHLTIADDGGGFSLSSAETVGAGGFGLIGIRERAQLLHGVLAIRSAPGAGTTVTIHFPIGSKRV